jgi:hypothetical protein
MRNSSSGTGFSCGFQRNLLISEPVNTCFISAYSGKSSRRLSPEEMIGFSARATIPLFITLNDGCFSVTNSLAEANLAMELPITGLVERTRGN